MFFLTLTCLILCNMIGDVIKSLKNKTQVLYAYAKIVKNKVFLFFCKFDSIFTVTFENIPIFVKLHQLVIHFKTVIPTFLIFS